MKQLRRVPLVEVVDDIIVEESLEKSQNVYIRVYRITIIFKGTKSFFYYILDSELCNILKS